MQEVKLKKKNILIFSLFYFGLGTHFCIGNSNFSIFGDVPGRDSVRKHYLVKHTSNFTIKILFPPLAVHM